MRKRTVGTPDGRRDRGRAARCGLDRQRLAVGDQVHREAHRGSGSPEAGGRARGCDRHVQGDADRHEARRGRSRYSHLSGAALAAHIHLGKKGVAGNVLVPLCPTADLGVVQVAPQGHRDAEGVADQDAERRRPLRERAHEEERERRDPRTDRNVRSARRRAGGRTPARLSRFSQCRKLGSEFR